MCPAICAANCVRGGSARQELHFFDDDTNEPRIFLVEKLANVSLEVLRHSFLLPGAHQNADPVIGSGQFRNRRLGHGPS
jgi:hypothetical protein